MENLGARRQLQRAEGLENKGVHGQGTRNGRGQRSKTGEKEQPELVEMEKKDISERIRNVNDCCAPVKTVFEL